jgi:1,4-dihydroxy-2-naphthoyl-CoA hydrolase
MAIWFRPFTIADIARLRKGTMVEHIGIEITEIGDDFLRGTMPVDARTRQAMGLLHGGASVALAESLGSIAGAMVIDLGRQSVVGLEINASHVRAVRSGFVTGTARPVNIGRRVQVWQVDIANAAGKQVCISRLTLFVLDRPPPPITEPASR